MYGSIFIGDDYLLGVACFHLKFRGNFDDKVFKSGFCVSGQTIRDATEHIKRSITEDDERPKSGLVYLGASDIIKGKKFYEMKKDFDDFVKTCVTRNFSLVLCTLTPIPSHQGNFLSNYFVKIIFFLFSGWQNTDIKDLQLVLNQ